MRLTERLLLIDVADDPGEEGNYVLVDELRGVGINCELEDLANILILPLYLAALYPPLKEAVLARLLTLDEERRDIICRVVLDAAEDIRRAAP